MTAILSFVLLILVSNIQDEILQVSNDESFTEYNGTASVTQGAATTNVTNLYLAGQRVAGLGMITSKDNKEWIVPAEVNYRDPSFPFAPDLYNPDATKHATANEALAAYKDTDIIETDASGDVITAYIFGDNYFEMYVNGIPVGKDAIPFTQFNSHILKFKVTRPFTIAMKLVDWEENLGLGTEANRQYAHHAGDGGMVAVFHDSDGNTIATTGSEWKAQTFYTAPIKDLLCPSENGTIRSTSSCDSQDEEDGSFYFALHWELPTTWMNVDFNDAAWPDATTYTNATIGVDNKPAYTNFIDVFDNKSDDAEFIWSTNVILDNEIIVRYTVQ